MLELLFAYLAGLLTLINPCVIPVLPIVLASAARGTKSGPVALALGMGLSFVTLGMIVATIGNSIGLTEHVLSRVGAVLMMGFGLILIVPAFEHRFATATAGFAGAADSRMDNDPTGFAGQFLGGILLGAVWSPCIGPTLGGAIALASQGQELLRVFFIMVAFAGGVATIILALAYGTREAIGSRQANFRAMASKTKPLLGWAFLAVGLMLFFNIHHIIEAWLVRVLPFWLQDLSVAF